LIVDIYVFQDISIYNNVGMDYILNLKIDRVKMREDIDLYTSIFEKG